MSGVSDSQVNNIDVSNGGTLLIHPSNTHSASSPSSSSATTTSSRADSSSPRAVVNHILPSHSTVVPEVAVVPIPSTAATTTTLPATATADGTTAITRGMLTVAPPPPISSSSKKTQTSPAATAATATQTPVDSVPTTAAAATQTPVGSVPASDVLRRKAIGNRVRMAQQERDLMETMVKERLTQLNGHRSQIASTHGVLHDLRHVSRGRRRREQDPEANEATRPPARRRRTQQPTQPFVPTLSHSAAAPPSTTFQKGALVARRHRHIPSAVRAREVTKRPQEERLGRRRKRMEGEEEEKRRRTRFPYSETRERGEKRGPSAFLPDAFHYEPRDKITNTQDAAVRKVGAVARIKRKLKAQDWQDAEADAWDVLPPPKRRPQSE